MMPPIQYVYLLGGIGTCIMRMMYHLFIFLIEAFLEVPDTDMQHAHYAHCDVTNN